jgi:hypothetical protein
LPLTSSPRPPAGPTGTVAIPAPPRAPNLSSGGFPSDQGGILVPRRPPRDPEGVAKKGGPTAATPTDRALWLALVVALLALAAATTVRLLQR